MNRKGSILLSTLLVTFLVAVSSGILSAYSLKKDLVDKYGGGGGVITPTNLSNSIPTLPTNQIVFSDGSGLIGGSDFTFNDTTNQLALNGNASTTQLGSTGSSYFATTNGSVGIGTTTPGALLAVQGNVLFSGNLNLANLTATGTLNVTGLTTLGYASSTQLTTTGSTYLATTGGNVGIGTTNPKVKMQVGSGVLVGEYFIPTFGVAGTEAALALQATGYDQWNLVAPGTGAVAGDFSIYNGPEAQHRFTIKNNTGNVGIGTTTPATKIHAWDASANTYFTVGVQATGNAGIILDSANGDAAGSDYFTIVHDRTTNTLQQGYANASTFNISSSGNVGIGTTTPVNKLDVNVGSNQLDGVTVTGSDSPLFALISTGATPQQIAMRLVPGDGTFRITDYTGLDGTPSHVADFLTIDTTGNVGIGTTSPATLLSVEGTATTTAYINSTTGGSGSGIQLKSPDGAYYCVYVANGGTLTTAPGACK